MKTSLKVTIGVAIFAIMFACFLWLLFLNHVGVTTIGIAYNSVSGKITVQSDPGWYVTSPWTRVVHLSTLPIRVTIPSNATIINSKIVRFRPEGAIDFVKRQGFSWTLGDNQENIMMGYAFSGQKFQFLEIVEEERASTN